MDADAVFLQVSTVIHFSSISPLLIADLTLRPWQDPARLFEDPGYIETGTLFVSHPRPLSC